MTFLTEEITEHEPLDDFPRTTERVRTSTNALGVSAASFAREMSKAFADATGGGRKFDDVLRQLALRLSGMATAQAFQPLARGLADGRSPDAIGLIGNLNGVTPFADGGVLGTPAYFPLMDGVGLAGEAGPEAILPLRRGTDGRLGVAMNGAGAVPNVTVHITTPDAESFRRSETYLTGQIARAVARGQRNL
ncbi:MAG TPA: phage tail tape measure protein [Pseudolabrys sp.]|jgi:phage-related minor tail protein